VLYRLRSGSGGLTKHGHGSLVGSPWLVAERFSRAAQGRH